MKTLAVLLLVLFFKINIALSADSLYLKGYYFVSYDEKDIKQRTRSKDTKTLSLVIDKKYSEYFLADITLNKGNIDSLFDNGRNIFIISRVEWFSILKDYCKIQDIEIDKKSVFQSNIYYKLRKNKKFRKKRYQVFYVEGFFYREETNKCINDILSKNMNNINKSFLYLPINISKINNTPNVFPFFKQVSD